MTMQNKNISNLKNIAYVNQKGGAGKTTASVLTSLACNHLQRGVEILDRDDDQQTATECWQQIEKTPAPAKTEIRIIDTPPDLKKKGFQDGIKAAHLVIVVSSPSPADLWSSKRTVQEVRRLTKAPIYILFNKIRKGTIFSTPEHLEDMAKKMEAPRLDCSISQSEVYQHSLVLGWSALHKKHKEEITRLVMEILTKVPSGSF
ncbi:MAG: ParA family protein [Verrucomicrobiota bacterium]